MRVMKLIFLAKEDAHWSVNSELWRLSIAVSLMLVVYWHIYYGALRGLYSFSDQSTLYRGMFSK